MSILLYRYKKAKEGLARIFPYYSNDLFIPNELSFVSSEVPIIPNEFPIIVGIRVNY